MLSSVKNVEKNMKLNILKSKRLEHYEMLRRGQRVETEMKKSFLFFRLSWVRECPFCLSDPKKIPSGNTSGKIITDIHEDKESSF